MRSPADSLSKGLLADQARARFHVGVLLDFGIVVLHTQTGVGRGLSAGNVRGENPGGLAPFGRVGPPLLVCAPQDVQEIQRRAGALFGRSLACARLSCGGFHCRQ